MAERRDIHEQGRKTPASTRLHRNSVAVIGKSDTQRQKRGQ
jgi:hypothetical protein